MAHCGGGGTARPEPPTKRAVKCPESRSTSTEVEETTARRKKEGSELARLGKATKASDVFASGVLMMEVACGRRPIWENTNNGEPLALADWVIAAWMQYLQMDAVPLTKWMQYNEDYFDINIIQIIPYAIHTSPSAERVQALAFEYSSVISLSLA